jgi:hypothetical protein
MWIFRRYSKLAINSIFDFSYGVGTQKYKIEQSIQCSYLHHGHNTIPVCSENLHHIFTSRAEIALYTTNLHSFHKHSCQTEGNLHWRNHFKHATAFYIQRGQLCIRNRMIKQFFLECTFSGNFSRFIEASKQSPKSICKIFPLQNIISMRKSQIVALFHRCFVLIIIYL